MGKRKRQPKARHRNAKSTSRTEPAWLRVVGARHNNLKTIDVDIPLSRFVCVTGVSGSGKSSLVNDILREALARDLNGAENVNPGRHERIEGLEHLDKVIDIDQSPIGRTPRSNPATYIKVFDEIRTLYTKLPDSKVRGYKPGRFSFNVSCGAAGGGRCEACEGNGSNRIEMDFLADVWVTCPVCEGRRFTRETLHILFKGKSIADVLDMDVQEALDHFEAVPQIAAMLRTLHNVGLDYLKLGQPSPTLSGGEAQRIKLARELVKKSTGRTLYLLDEPTTGLHFADIKRLLAVLHRFVDEGHSVVVIEHNLDVIKTADWVIDLGPEGGEAGGRIVVEGTPEDVARCQLSYTGDALRGVLNIEPGRQPGNGATRQTGITNYPLPVTKKGQRNGQAAHRPSSIGPGLPEPSSRSDHRQSTFANLQSTITVVGAKQHNLKDITVSFPRGKTTVCCGPSGSGKSSFAIDTVYSEGQRRYVESLSAYARQFLSRLQPPKVDHVYGLSPSICIEQKTTSRSPRSTVGTITEIYDYLRVLWARIGQPYCPACRISIGTQTSDEIVAKLLAMGEGAHVLLTAPIEPGAGESYEQLFRRERANGYARVRVDGHVFSLNGPVPVEARRRHRVELVVDRVVVHQVKASRLTDSVEQALALGAGVMNAIVEESLTRNAEMQKHRNTGTGERPNIEPLKRRNAGTKGGMGLATGGLDLQSGPVGVAKGNGIESCPSNESGDADHRTELRFSQHLACLQCGRSFEELTPHHFSFNTRMGWCEACEGLGTQHGAGVSTIVVHPTRSLLDGAIGQWGSIKPGTMLHDFVHALARHMGFDPKTPWNELEEKARLAILHGCGELWIEVRTKQKDIEGPRASKSATDEEILASRGLKPAPRVRFQWNGFFPAVARATRSSWQYRKRLEDLVTEVPCDACAGGRLRPEPAAVRVGGSTIHEVCLRPLGKTLDWFENLKLSARERQIAGELLHEITSRLRFLVDVGLEYLSLHRTGATLSGGESQRIQLASQIGTGLTGVLYVLDEPTIGLHPRDNARLIGALQRLRDLGNTLLLVEHDRDVIHSADHVLDFGPGAGTFGGTITAEGRPSRLRKNKASLTGRYLSNQQAIPIPRNRRAVEESTPRLIVHGARENNLREIDVSFPLGRFICVTGVSGSGKSTLVSDILYHALAQRIHRAQVVPGGHERLSGLNYVDKVVNVDQAPLGSSPTSNPATYTGVFDAVRELFAKLPESKIRGYSVNRFSFNRPGGRCEACEGMGQRCIEMHFLPDVWVECENCAGKRYETETLEVRFRGRNIADVLDLRVSEALELFANIPKIRKMLQTLDDVGLGYVQLGQSAATLSAGEAQRVKLAGELGRPSTGKTVYILDEPTTGLHFDDIHKLLNVLHRLVDLGNTCICIEHNLDVIKTADWVIDLGPEAGEAGGAIVVEGTPESISQCASSHTGQALQPILEAGPRRDREVRVQKKVGEIVKDVQRPVDLGDDVRMPWEKDGQAWHTVTHRDREGKPCQWDVGVLVWLVEAMESFGAFAPTDWNHRSMVEIKPAGTTAPWFCHFRTGDTDLLNLAVRVPKGSLNGTKIKQRMKIPTLDERDDLPIYGQWDRVRHRSLHGGWEEWSFYLRDFKDVSKPPFRWFLKDAAEAFRRRAAEIQADPMLSKPWTKDGRAWHLSQKSIHQGHAIQWNPSLLMELIGRLKKLQPDLQDDWNHQTAVMLRLPGEDAAVGRIVTNIGQGLRVELRAPAFEFTPTQVDRLGRDVEIKQGPNYDRVSFWLTSMDQLDVRQLADVWRQCRGAGVKPTVQFA